MIELVGVHRAHHEQVVRDRAEVRQQVAEIHPALAVFFERALRAHQPRRFFFDESEAHFFQQRIGQRLAVELVELWLRIEEIELARRAFHEDENAVLRLRREVRPLRQEWIGRRGRGRREQAVGLQHRAEREHAEAARRRGEKIAAREMDGVVEGMHGWFADASILITENSAESSPELF